MCDPRHAQLAKLLADFSTKLQPGERVLIDAYDIPESMTIALVRAARACGALPFVQIHTGRVAASWRWRPATHNMSCSRRSSWRACKKMQAYIALRGSHNITEMSDVPGDRMKLVMKADAAGDSTSASTRRSGCVLRWPTAAMAQQAGMSTEAFEDFYFDVCTLDYAKMGPA